MDDVLRESGNSGGNNIKPAGFASWDALYANWKSWKRPYKIEEINKYTDPETGEADYVTVRFIPKEGERKQFLQAHKNGSWKAEAPKEKTPLFNRVRIQESDNILVVEGEKCVRAFTKLGLPNWAATTNAGGANGVDKADWSPLRGKDCYIWHDNDEPGLKHYESVKAILAGYGCNIYRVKVEELGLDVKEDIADYIEQNEGLPEDQVSSVLLALSDAESFETTTEFEERFNAIISGEYKNILFHGMPKLSELSKALLPGTVTTFVGDPEAGKSFFLLEQFWKWRLQDGLNVKALFMEDDLPFHQQRMLVQMAGDSRLADDVFIAHNGDYARECLKKFKPYIEEVSKHLTIVPSQMTLKEVGAWVTEQAEVADIIIVDPVTAAQVGDKSFIEDLTYMFQVKNVMKKTKKRLLQSTHPRIGKAGVPGLDGVAGGAAYPRFSQSLLWLKKFPKPKESFFWEPGGRVMRPHRRAIGIYKARSGIGGGQEIAVDLDFHTLRMTEYGVVEDE